MRLLDNKKHSLEKMEISINLIFAEHYPQRKTYTYIFPWFSLCRYTLQKVKSTG